MNKTILTLCILSICSLAAAGDYICYDGSGIITQRRRSISGPNNLSCDNNMKISREVLEGITRYKKVVNRQVVDMSQEEIDAIIQTEADAIEESTRISINNLQVTQKEAWLAWLALYNSKVPVQYRIIPLELKNQVFEDKGITP